MAERAVVQGEEAVTESKKPTGSTARPVLDPDAELSDATRKVLLQALEDPRRYVGRPANPLWAAVPLLARGGAGVAAAAVVWRWTGGLEIADPASDSSTLVGAQDQLLQKAVDLVHTLLAVWPLAAGVVAVLCAGLVADRALYNGQLRRLAAAQQHLVHPRDLTADAQELLARAQRAMTAVLDSKVHREQWLDAQRNEAAFPRQAWAIAHDLRDYSRVARKEHRTPQETDNATVAELLTSRRRVLATSLHGIERRVAALEAYASQVAEADARYAEVREIERLAAGSDELLDLLARTTADDLAVAEIDALTDEAAVVASTFTKALESAKQAAAAALPLQDAA
ncbi:hypothetical protein ADL00_23665 [Streptomyces sp. AS58]|uniref:hypothetical protein n=1 Tax=Streptomyces sp. AS58 TaxID=1519489 RepID=UPI0006ADD185|nr:hypothetical protein [Streptomyces sp. AS58]KOV62954.1 hypothetical protein ADL00_23665 [Streptomyces sp. AS58]